MYVIISDSKLNVQYNILVYILLKQYFRMTNINFNHSELKFTNENHDLYINTINQSTLVSNVHCFTLRS